MTELVFLDPPAMQSTPFTTSEVIAEYAGVQYHAVQQMCARYREDLEAFGVFAFEMRKPPEGSKGGRPETVYHLNGWCHKAGVYYTSTDKMRLYHVKKTHSIRQPQWHVPKNAYL